MDNNGLKIVVEVSLASLGILSNLRVKGCLGCCLLGDLLMRRRGMVLGGRGVEGYGGRGIEV